MKLNVFDLHCFVNLYDSRDHIFTLLGRCFTSRKVKIQVKFYATNEWVCNDQGQLAAHSFAQNSRMSASDYELEISI